MPTNTFDLGFSADLPVFVFQKEIVDAIDTHQVTIITAETGAGKSTQIPQYLAEHGYEKVIVTQPRILAARNLTHRVREEWAARTSSDSTPIIGYRTAQERDDDSQNRILYCTDGLQLVREITGSGISQRQVLVLDEVHEWNENMEVLVAWAKKRCLEDPSFKVVVMSATIDTEPLANYFHTTAVISVPGRSYDVIKRRGRDVISEIFEQIASGSRNVLVFLPGKSEIQQVADAISSKATQVGIPVIPLHSQLEATAQQQAFTRYSNGKVILATNIAQTSVTIDDIDVVIDSGLERRSEVRSGVEGLFITQTSQADCLQRAGRAGRTKNGEYILAPFDTLPCAAFEDRDMYGTPEILRKHIDRLTLRLANVGIDIETLDFFHDPSRMAMKQAKRTLVALGALTSSGSVTSIGRSMERYPVESSYARMLVESQQYGEHIQTTLAAIIAIQEVGGIVKGGPRYTGWQRLTKQRRSDLIAQYDVYRSAATILPDEYEELGIIAKNLSKASEVMQRLNHDLVGISLNEDELDELPPNDQTTLLHCIVAGQIDQLWSIDGDNNATNIFTKNVREVSSSTVLRNPVMVAGTAFDLEVPTREGNLQTLHLVQDLTEVKMEWLLQLSPELFQSTRGKMIYDPRSGHLAIRQSVKVGKHTFEAESIPIDQNNKQNQKFFQEAVAKWIYGQLQNEKIKLEASHSKRIPNLSFAKIKGAVTSLARGVIAIQDIPADRKKELFALTSLQTHFGSDFMQHIARSYRKPRGNGRHHAHRGWKPGHKKRQKRVERLE